MTSGGIKMGMTPPHPGAFIRIEALDELGLSVSAAARILGVRRAARLVPEMFQPHPTASQPQAPHAAR